MRRGVKREVGVVRSGVVTNCGIRTIYFFREISPSLFTVISLHESSL